MSYNSYSKTVGLASECDPECKKWQSVQKHKFCFHASHATPLSWDQCGQVRRHREDVLLVLHPQQSVLLPNPLVEDAFSRKARVDSRLEKPFFADKEYRKQNDCQARKDFVNLGYSSAEITFSPDQKERLQAFIDRIANSSNRSGRKGGTYYDGRCGTPISKSDLIGLDCDVLETILSPFVITAICYYFGSARSPMLYDGEVIRVFAHATEQRGHTDISLEDIEEESLQVATSRLCVVAILSLDGPGTTLVYPQTRIDSSFEYGGRKCVRATEVNNLVLFDGRMGHKGAPNFSDKESRRLVLVFNHPDATEGQLEVMSRCLSRPSLSLSVEQLLNGSEPVARKKRSLNEESGSDRCLRSRQHATP